ncbi:MAG TPA: S9 family peptidase, partial [Thermoanaerobaculia bacterium]|nr:S9 family peptidase [Thermoanaerobaculia bacterium]
FPLPAGPAAPQRAAHVFALKPVSDPRLSPDGRRAAYVVGEWDFRENLLNTDVWLVDVLADPAAAAATARKLTASPKRDDTPRFSPDGRVIAFLSDRKLGDEKETFRQIWLIPVAGGEATRLTAHGAGVAAFAWSPDGKRVAFTAPASPTADERKRKDEKEDHVVVDVDDVKPAALWIVDVATKETVRVSASPWHVTSPDWSPDGKTIAATVAPSPKVPDSFNEDVALFEATGSGKGAEPGWLVRRPGPDHGPRFSPDGKRVAFLSADGRANDWPGNRAELCVVPAAGGEPRNLTKALGEDAGNVAWAADSSALYFTASERMASRVFRVPAAGGDVRPLTDGPEVVASLSLSRDGKRAAFVRQSSLDPPDVWWLPLATPAAGAKASAVRLTETNPALAAALRPKVERVSWKGPDGLDIEGLLLLPPDIPAKNLPLVLGIHGGPAGNFSHACGAFSRIYPWEEFVAKGVAVLLPNPRGSGGYGEAFRKANVRDWGGKDYEDLMAGVDALIAKGIADPARMGVMGWSYGGYMTSTIITKTDRFRFASPGAAVTDLWSFYFTADIPEFIESYFASVPWDDFDVLKSHSAMWGVKNVRTPTLILHGEADARVPTSQGRELFLALKKRGVPVEFVTYPREPHGPQEPKHVKDIRARLLAWTEKYLLGKN